MYLTASNLVHYLIHRGLIAADSVVAGDFAVIEAGRRNRNFKVLRRADRGLFIKQVPRTTWDAVSTVQREASFYALAHAQPASRLLARLLPRLVDYDPSTYTLITELLPDGENLGEYHFRVGSFPERTGETLGRALGEYHQQIGAFVGESAAAWVLPRQIPWLLRMEPDAILEAMSRTAAVGPQAAELLRRYPWFLEGLAQLRYEWQVDSLIHGDIKWDNCLLCDDARREAGLRVVDWELVDLGDASWDIASALASYMIFALLTLGVDSGAPPADLIRRAREKQQAMRPGVRGFWSSYCRARGIGPAAVWPYFLRCLRFCAARMVLAVFEHLAGAPQALGNAAALLQVGYGIFVDPVRAAAELLGDDGAAQGAA
jgi:Ser/Thr protein kinase RdoA (MazF antagonist)